MSFINWLYQETENVVKKNHCGLKKKSLYKYINVLYIYIKLHAIAWKKKCKKDNDIKHSTLERWRRGG